MQHAIGIRFLDENGNIREGELINPSKIIDRQVEVEFFGDNMLDVMCERSNGAEHIFRTHISRISAMFPAVGLPLRPVKRDPAIFDQDAP